LPLENDGTISLTDEDDVTPVPGGEDECTAGLSQEAGDLESGEVDPGLEDQNIYDESQYLREPDRDTVVDHGSLNLPGLGIVINKLYGLVICIACQRSVPLSSLRSHVKKHAAGGAATTDLVSQLRTEFDIAAEDEIPFPTDIPAPIFGIAMETGPFYFCGRCDHGYANIHSLRSHQNNAQRCARGEDEENEYTVGCAQSFSLGKHRAFFRVNPSALPLTKNLPVDYQRLYKKAPKPVVNFSKVAMQNPAYSQDLGQFMYRERWNDHVLGYTPEQICDMVRASRPDDGPLHTLRKYCKDYIRQVQAVIKSHASYGIVKQFAQVTE
jgi:hypothetical protein